MQDINVNSIKALRESTGAGVMDCKRALEEAKGDPETAQGLLRQWGVLAAAKRGSRTADDGLVEAYVHSGGRIGAIVELNCETDFVARTEEFQSLAHDVAMQVAAMAPLYITLEEIPTDQNLDPKEVCLLEQSFIREPDKTIRDLIEDARAKTGENIGIRRFTRFALGQD